TNTLLKNILKIIQNRGRIIRKPIILSISSLAEMDIFENINENDYFEIVMNYFRYVGGFNLKETLNLCLKEGLTDAITPLFTWFGREGGLRNSQRLLYNSRLIMAIYERRAWNSKRTCEKLFGQLRRNIEIKHAGLMRIANVRIADRNL
ncbi:uncharacterized protein LOC105422362, partial [Pogonomyrmex barbatus]|uniref:Uncharacterized protein LOC105422362 n=1 Tax=Pogonomyrmex barbatus TaxID=144034 RepID=A0A6I9VTK4_9HYME